MGSLTDLLNEEDSLISPKLGDSVGGTPNKDLMADARSALSGNWGLAILGYILYIALLFCFAAFLSASVLVVKVMSAAGGSDPTMAVHSMKFFSSMVELLISGAVAVGFMGFFLGIAEDGAARLELLFVGFQRFWKSFAVYFLYSLFIILWSLLLIIPGIIATFRYAMVFFIIADDEDCGAWEALGRSKEMMKGNKWKLFCLHWRFFGWALLATFFTFGIGYLWLVPYMQTSFAKFYADVR